MPLLPVPQGGQALDGLPELGRAIAYVALSFSIDADPEALLDAVRPNSLAHRLEEQVKQTKEQVKQRKEQVTEQVKHTKGQVTEQVKQTKDQVTEQVKQTKDQVTEQVKQTKEQVDGVKQWINKQLEDISIPVRGNGPHGEDSQTEQLKARRSKKARGEGSEERYEERRSARERAGQSRSGRQRPECGAGDMRPPPPFASTPSLPRTGSASELPPSGEILGLDLPAEGWISYQQPNGRIFWHHRDLGPAPWEATPTLLQSRTPFDEPGSGGCSERTYQHEGKRAPVQDIVVTRAPGALRERV